MAKRRQEQKEEDRIVAKSKHTATNLSSHVPTSSSSPKGLIASKSQGILIATGKPVSRIRGNSEYDAASSFQARLEDAHLGESMDKATGKPVATKEEPRDVDLSESQTGSEENVTGKAVAYKTATEKPCASSKSDCQGSPKAEKTEWTHNLRVSPATVHRLLDRQGDLNDLDVNMPIWETSISSSWKRP